MLFRSNCIFWKNDRSDGSRTGQPYELDVNKSAHVEGCFIFGTISDLQKSIAPDLNQFSELDPKFDSTYVPQSPHHQEVGYRPVTR